MIKPVPSPEQEQKIQIRIATVQYINLAGWGLIFFSLTALIFASIPFEISRPAWQFGFYKSIINNVAIVLVGAVLLIVAKLLNPKDPMVRAHADFIQSISPAIAVGLVLLVPLQIYSGVAGIYDQKILESKRVNSIRKVMLGIENSNNEAELRDSIMRMPNPPDLPQTFDMPFPTLQKVALRSLRIRLSAELDQIKIIDLNRWQAFALECLRNSIQVLIMAMVFFGLPKQEPNSY